MLYIILIGAVYSLFCAYAYKKRNTDFFNTRIYVLFVFALLIRFLSSYIYPGYAVDMNCFSAWADSAYSGGLYSFYTGGMFSDYPPGYIYILYIIGFLKNIFSFSSAGEIVLLKTPAIVCDILCAVIIYKLANRNKCGGICAALFLFNPSIILNSAIWGQVDSVFTLFVLLTLYLAYDNKLCPAFFAFAAAVFIKPQALFYTPVLIFMTVKDIFYPQFSSKKLLHYTAYALCAVGLICLMSLPFNISAVMAQYAATIGSYNFASVNAYNLWTALGLNWHTPSGAVSAAGYISIAITVAVSAYLFFNKNGKRNIFYISAFICLSVFMLSVKMHDRYAYPAIPLMLCAYALTCEKSEMYLFGGISFFQFVNAAHVLFYYDAETYGTSHFAQTACITAVFAVIFYISAVILTFKRRKFYEKN